MENFKKTHIAKIISMLLIMLMIFALSACGSSSGELEQTESTVTNSSETERTSTNIDQAEEDTAETTMIRIVFCKTEVLAELDDSDTSKAFIKKLPMTLTMSRYADREYYAAIDELPEGGEAIPDFENGDVTYYTAGKSLAIFFGNAESSSQTDLIRMGRIISDLSLFDEIGDSVSVTITLAKEETGMMDYDFSVFTNVEITGVDLDSLNEDKLSVLYAQARYCQAMTDADIDTLRELVTEDATFTHMSGKRQTREEYFADIADGSLDYYTVGLENPVVKVNGDMAEVTCTTVLTANAYGARGSWPFTGTRHFERVDGKWITRNR